MAYRYSIEKLTNKHVSINDLQKNEISIMYILCYYIEDQCKYPFLQFLLERIPYCQDIMEDQLTLPYIIFGNNNYDNVDTVVLEKIDSCLKNIDNDIKYNISEEMYKGIIYSQDGLSCYALLNISGLNIGSIVCDKNSCTWFVLTSEIINTKSVCNIPIDKEVVKLFSDNPEMGVLTNKHNTINTFIIPDAVYTISDKKTTEFISVFNNIKTKKYESCGEYYYFYRGFEDVTKDLNIDLDYGINRYALFVEGKLYMEKDNDLNLTDKIIENLYPEECIIICFLKNGIVKPDILVKSYDSFKCISYLLN